MPFYIWKSEIEEGYCIVTMPEGIEDIQLSDNLSGAVYIIVSKAIRDCLADAKINNVEFLPITIYNHKGRVASHEYYILNPLDISDCIDIKASKVEWNSIAKDRIDFCDHLVLNESLIPSNFKIFRPKFWPSLILVRQEITEMLINAGFTGLYFIDASGYDGIA
jgi:hypothetical protein